MWRRILSPECSAAQWAAWNVFLFVFFLDISFTFYWLKQYFLRFVLLPWCFLFSSTRSSRGGCYFGQSAKVTKTLFCSIDLVRTSPQWRFNFVTKVTKIKHYYSSALLIQLTNRLIKITARNNRPLRLWCTLNSAIV